MAAVALVQQDERGDSELTLEERLNTMMERTPEQFTEARRRILAASRKPRPLPPGKTLEAVVVGRLQDKEREDVMVAALQEIA